MPPARWRERIYTDETRLRGLEILIFLVHEGGLCLCRRVRVAWRSHIPFARIY
jgi:hypothetical protein